jgi:hypothetical protein
LLAAKALSHVRSLTRLWWSCCLDEDPRRRSSCAPILFTAILFSAPHLDVHGFPLRAALGALLGWIAWRTASILPAILAHAFYDTTALAIGVWQIHHGHAANAGITTDKWAMAIGAALIAAAVTAFTYHGRPARALIPSHGTPEEGRDGGSSAV